MTGLKIGYARVSTDDQDLTAQRDALTSPSLRSASIPTACTSITV